MSAFHEGLLARSKVAPASRSIAPPAESCVDKSVHCLQEIDVDSAQRSTTLGFSEFVIMSWWISTCRLLGKGMCRQETIRQRATSARPRPPLRSTEVLRSSARLLQLSLVLQTCCASIKRNVHTEQHKVLRSSTAALLSYKQHCIQRFLTQRSKIRLRPRSKLSSCQKD